MLWGGVMGTIAWALYGRLSLGAIMFAAMVLNLLLAAFVGALVPMALKRIGQDPALGSSIILTGFTDSFGFLIFLGLAASFLGVRFHRFIGMSGKVYVPVDWPRRFRISSESGFCE